MAVRMRQYLHEMQTCLRIGATWPERTRLAWATLDFHVANLLHLNQFQAGETATPYRVRIKQKQVDLWLRRRSGDLFIFHEIFTNTCYRLPNGLCGAATIVDLGANIGATTLFFSQYFPEARYVCVEPNPANATILRQNLSSFNGRAEVIEAAISDHSGLAKFDDTGWSWGGRILEESASGRAIQCCTMDEILASCGVDTIDLLKVDVEGAELQLFRNTPGWLSKVRSIIIELHAGYSLHDFERDIAPAGFAVVPGGSRHGTSMTMAFSRGELPKVIPLSAQ